MRASLHLLFLLLPTAPAAVAQVPAAQATAAYPIASTPFLLKQKETRVQTLADGTRITTVRDFTIARDSAGRRSQTVVAEPPSPELALTDINDPQAHTFTTVDSRNKKVYVTDMRPPSAEALARQREAATSFAPNPVRLGRTEATNLGTRSLNGLEVQGERYTTTYDIGVIGNDHALVVTNDTWRAPALDNEVVEHTFNDPRTGTITTVITDLERGEPDPSLFRVPADYVTIQR